MIDVEVEVDMASAMERLAAMQARMKNFTPVFRWARTRLEQANAANFAANGLPAGETWDPLDPQYGRWKSVNFPGRPTLVRSGRLFRSLTNLRGAPSFIRPDVAEFGTSVKYARFHQDGTFKMPKRQIIFEPVGFAFALGERTASYVANGTL